MLLDSISATKIHLGLDRIRMVLKEFSYSPHCPIVTVGGTNGKGSTVFLISRFFESAGYKVGTYTSPHLHTVHERIVVNQQPIAEHDLARLLESLDSVLKKNSIKLTYFEILTVVALLYFQEQGCTQMVLEVGMGGRLDAVNVLDPTVAVLTTVSIDHREWLGDTLEAIAIEKSGIARAGCPVLVGVGAQSPALQKALEGIGARIEYENRDFCCSFSSTGSFLPTHIALAVRACERVIGHSIEITPDFESWIWPGRFERYQAYGTDWILDVAHNQESVLLLVNKLKKIRQSYRGVVAVWHSLVDKELDVIVQTIAPIIDYWIVAEIENDRAAPLEVLRDTIIRHGGAVEPSITPYTEQGYLIVVFGGFNVVANFKRLLK